MSLKKTTLSDRTTLAALVKRPGVYVASSTEPAFGILLGAVSLGLGHLIGERFPAPGVRRIAVEVGDVDLRRNPEEFAGEVTIGREYFSAALREYQNWPVKWWREAIQNAVDAGASEIACLVEPQLDGTVRVSCEDDGRGMDRDTLIQKFLVLGGTTKAGGGGTTGGFGEAKKLLLLPWISWEIQSRDGIARGANVKYRYEQQPASRRGTRLIVVMPGDKYATEEAALTIIKRSTLPGIRFRLSTGTVSARHDIGDEVESAIFAQLGGQVEVYYNKKAEGPGLWVRKNGLFMFDRYLSDSIQGIVCCEIIAESTAVLTANRDGFAEWRIGHALDTFTGKISADVTSALRKKHGIIRKKFVGSGKFTLPALKAAVEESAFEESSIKAGKPSDALIERIVQALEKATVGGGDVVAREGEGQVTTFYRGTSEDEPTTETETGETEGIVPGELRASPEAARGMLDGLNITGPAQLEAIAKQLSWEPDFYVVNEVEGFRVPRKFFPETMAPQIRKLARFWAELCRFVLMQFGSDKDYGVGFIFDSEKGGMQLTEETGERWILLNPFRHGLVGGELMSLANKEDLAFIYAIAVHECVHHHHDLSDHNEPFANALTRAFAKTAGKERQIKAIKQAVTARGPKKAKTRETEPEVLYDVMFRAGGFERPYYGVTEKEIAETKAILTERYGAGSCSLVNKSPHGKAYQQWATS